MSTQPLSRAGRSTLLADQLTALRRAAVTGIIDALWRAIGQSIDAFTPAECASDLDAAGYVPLPRHAVS